MNIKQLTEFYHDQLYHQILPFWLKNGIDSDYGGYFTCFSNTGSELVSTDKYVWSQGRLIWIFSKLAELNKEGPDYLGLARSGVDYLKKYGRLVNGNCVFLLSREGQAKEPIKEGGFDTSIYADCFVILGFSKYAAISGERHVLDIALQIYDSVLDRIERNNFRTEPEPAPPGYKVHGIAMILLNTCQELAQALAAFKDPRLPQVELRSQDLVQEISTDFLTNDGILLEMIDPSLKRDDSIVGRYINPGHTIESMWFVMHEAMKLQDGKLIQTAVSVIEKMFQLGWDDEYGGLFQFTDRDGGPPQSKLADTNRSGIVEKLRHDWNNKLWWVHSEALYATLLAYYLTKQEKMFDLYHKTHDYTFKTFPNPDQRIGEWIQIRDRVGHPVEKIVALPVKDPFHITRNFIQIIELLTRFA